MSRVAPSALPRSRASLALLPTPVHRLGWPEEVDVELYIKRDDLTSFELSGNKIRKLEFLLADAIENGYDSVVTTGQSYIDAGTYFGVDGIKRTPMSLLLIEQVVSSQTTVGRPLWPVVSSGWSPI